MLISKGKSYLHMRIMCKFTTSTFWFWFSVPHVRLHRIRLMNAGNCTQCWRQGTILHRLTECGVTGDKGIDRTRDSSDAKDGHETCTQGINSSCLLQNLAPTKTGDLVVSGECGFLCDESKRYLIGTGLHWLYGSDAVEDITTKKVQLVGNLRKVF